LGYEEGCDGWRRREVVRDGAVVDANFGGGGSVEEGAWEECEEKEGTWFDFGHGLGRKSR